MNKMFVLDRLNVNKLMGYVCSRTVKTSLFVKMMSSRQAMLAAFTTKYILSFSNARTDN
ncbi:hypothetical protein GCM10022397_14890 [Flavivirga jejuensis]